jgi:hypothetical protein
MRAEVHLECISDDFSPCTVPADSQEVNFAQEGRIKTERQHPGLVHAEKTRRCITFSGCHLLPTRRGGKAKSCDGPPAGPTRGGAIRLGLFDSWMSCRVSSLSRSDCVACALYSTVRVSVFVRVLVAQCSACGEGLKGQARRFP